MIEQIRLKEQFQMQDIISAEPEASIKDEPDIEKQILCRNCSAHITLKSEEFSFNNSDFHLFKNPAGIYFRVVCFKNAPGCLIISDYTEKFTWFEGYSWAIALCRVCHAHLGWHYISLERTFFGLVADRLTGI